MSSIYLCRNKKSLNLFQPFELKIVIVWLYIYSWKNTKYTPSYYVHQCLGVQIKCITSYNSWLYHKWINCSMSHDFCPLAFVAQLVFSSSNFNSKYWIFKLKISLEIERWHITIYQAYLCGFPCQLIPIINRNNLIFRFLWHSSL